jgi:hypothetical protein
MVEPKEVLEVTNPGTVPQLATMQQPQRSLSPRRLQLSIEKTTKRTRSSRGKAAFYGMLKAKSFSSATARRYLFSRL